MFRISSQVLNGIVMDVGAHVVQNPVQGMHRISVHMKMKLEQATRSGFSQIQHVSSGLSENIHIKCGGHNQKSGIQLKKHSNIHMTAKKKIACLKFSQVIIITFVIHVFLN